MYDPGHVSISHRATSRQITITHRTLHHNPLPIAEAGEWTK
jgi:hypothetical protein